MPDHLTDLEHLLLLAVLALGDDAYGAALQRHLASEAGRRVSLGTIHVTMNRLEDRGLIRSALGPPTAARGGKAKRFYTVRPAGVAALQRDRAVLERLWNQASVLGRRP
jgi:PadR family transcriptional regulator